MSNRYFLLSSRIECFPVPLYAFQEIRVGNGCRRHQFNAAIKQFRQALIESQIGIRIDGWFEFIKQDKKVKVTGVRVKLARSCGAKQLQSPDVVTATQLLQFITILEMRETMISTL